MKKNRTEGQYSQLVRLYLTSNEKNPNDIFRQCLFTTKVIERRKKKKNTEIHTIHANQNYRYYVANYTETYFCKHKQLRQRNSLKTFSTFRPIIPEVWRKPSKQYFLTVLNCKNKTEQDSLYHSNSLYVNGLFPTVCSSHIFLSSHNTEAYSSKHQAFLYHN